MANMKVVGNEWDGSCIVACDCGSEEPVVGTMSQHVNQSTTQKPVLTKGIVNDLLLARSYMLQHLPGSVWEGNTSVMAALEYVQQLGEWYHEEGAFQIFIGEDNG